MHMKKEILKGAENVARRWFRWAFWGAALGALAGGAVGFWFEGFSGVLFGAAGGAVVGAVLILALRLWIFIET